MAALERLGTETRLIELNSVDVEVPYLPLGGFVPLFRYPYPVESRPDFEKSEVEAIGEYVSEDDDVVIVGGGLGVTTVSASRHTSGEIYVYEQSERIFEILQRTVEINHVENTVHLYCGAVGHKSTSTYTYGDSTNPSIISPIDLPPADVYELDCEGAEVEILEEMTSKPSTLLIETHFNHEEVSELLVERGYEIIEAIDEDYPEPNRSHIRAKCTNEIG